uniref:Transmembrane protein n=1 Tax=Arundo donax TaxID=35708 RepID=A0A0A9EAL0_ARUDO
MTYQSRKTEMLSSARAAVVGSRRGTDNLAFGSTLPITYILMKHRTKKKRNKRFLLFSYLLVAWLYLQCNIVGYIRADAYGFS